MILGTVGKPDSNIWMTEETKWKLEQENSFYKQLSKNDRSESNFFRLQSIVNEFSEIISERKDYYRDELSKKLNDLQTSSKAYWSIF